jgi:hypothetical protein
MRAPLKLNRLGWPTLVTRFLSGADDPRPLTQAREASTAEFSRAVSVLKFGTTFKTTKPGRQPLADALVAARFAGERPSILDIGASDGSTSLDLIRRLGTGFERYYVTDYNIALEYAVDDDTTFFRSTAGENILAVTDRFVIYADTADALPPLGWFSTRILSRARALSTWTQVQLVQPELQRLAADDSRIEVRRYDVLQPWSGPPLDLVKVANVLNDAYFTPSEIRQAVRVQMNNLRENGILLVIDNRDDERISMFQRRGDRLELVETVHGGAAASAHVV